MSPKKGTRKSAKSTTATDKKSKGFTDEERAAMKERAQELKAEARRGARAGKADGESDVLAKIAEMPEPDRAMAKRLHAIIQGRQGRLLLPKRAQVQVAVRDVRLQRRGEPRRRRPVARCLCAEGVDRRRRDKDQRAREESGDLRTELTTGPRPRRVTRLPLVDPRSTSPGSIMFAEAQFEHGVDEARQ